MFLIPVSASFLYLTKNAMNIIITDKRRMREKTVNAKYKKVILYGWVLKNSAKINIKADAPIKESCTKLSLFLIGLFIFSLFSFVIKKKYGSLA